MRALTASLLVSLCALAVSAGCSSGASKNDRAGNGDTSNGGGATSPSAVSGTRLRVKSITGGGAREIVSFHDTERNEDCTFRLAESGHTRCVPTTVIGSQSGLFADPGCQVPSLSAPSPTCADDAKYAITATSVACSHFPQLDIRKLLDPSAARYTLGPTGCSVAPVAPVVPGRPATVPLGDVIPWTAFVEAVPMVVAGSPVSEKVLVATDGARQHLGYRDEKLGADCSFQLMSDGVTRCVPAAKQGQIFYGDGACTKALAVNDFVDQSCNAPPTDDVLDNLWIEPSPDVCGGLHNVYHLGAYDDQLAGSDVYQLTNQAPNMSSSSGSVAPSCTSSGTLRTGTSSFNYRRVGDVINTSLPSTPRVGTGGSDRLVPALVWPPAADTLVPGWHDTTSDVDCTFTLAGDGKIRCLPVASAATILFTDDSCKSPSVVAVLSDASCIGGVKRYARVVSTTCPPTTRIFSLGPHARSLSNASVATSSGQCGKVTQAEAAFDATEVDPSQFVEGIAAVE